MKVYNGFTGKTEIMPSSPTIQQMRQPGKYRVISDAQLKRDLAGRTLADVYRDNHSGRTAMAANSDTQYSPPFGKYQPRQEDAKGTLRSEYLAWCAARGHTPDPASLDLEAANDTPLAIAA